MFGGMFTVFLDVVAVVRIVSRQGVRVVSAHTSHEPKDVNSNDREERRAIYLRRENIVLPYRLPA